MANDIAKAIKRKADEQLRMMQNDTRTRFQEGANGDYNTVVPTDYQKGIMAGNNVALTQVGNNIEISAEMNIDSNTHVEVSAPAGDGAVTLTVIGGNADHLVGKQVAADNFIGKDGYVIAYDETNDRFYLKLDNGGGGESSEFMIGTSSILLDLDNSFSTIPAMVESIAKPA